MHRRLGLGGWLSCGALMIGSVAPGAWGDPTFRVCEIQFGTGDWSFAPILEIDDNGQTVVHSFLALIDPNASVDDNINAVWFVRGATSNDPWTSAAWNDPDQWVAISSVMQALSIPDADKVLFPTTGPTPELLPPPKPPKEYENGVSKDDEVALELTFGPERDIVIDVLVDIGYPAADITVEKLEFIASCGSATALDAFADGVETELAIIGDGVPTVQAAFATCNAGYPFCLPY